MMAMNRFRAASRMILICFFSSGSIVTSVPEMSGSQASSPASPPSCDFEVGLCGWRPSPATGYTFRLHQGPTPDRTSGPESDHTFQGTNSIRNSSKSSWRLGHYVFSSGWDATGTGQAARLLSPYLAVTHFTNVSFWYQMNGHGVGSLSLWLHHLSKQWTVSSRSSQVWVRRHRQGYQWHQDQVRLFPGQWQIEFRTTLVHDFGSDIALDDISFNPPNYINVVTTVSPPTSTTPSPTTSTSRPSKPPSSITSRLSTPKPATSTLTSSSVPRGSTSGINMPQSASTYINTQSSKKPSKVTKTPTSQSTIIPKTTPSQSTKKPFMLITTTEVKSKTTPKKENIVTPKEEDVVTPKKEDVVTPKKEDVVTKKEDAVTPRIDTAITSAPPKSSTTKKKHVRSEASNASGGLSPGDRNIVIGVCVGVGAVAVIAGAMYMYKRSKSSHDGPVQRKIKQVIGLKPVNEVEPVIATHPETFQIHL